MPYRSKKKRRLYAAKWRKKHRDYMRDYGRAIYHGQEPDCLLRKSIVPPVPAQSEAEIRAGLKLPVSNEVETAVQFLE